MRRPITINAKQCGSLWKFVKARCLHLDVESRCTRSADGMILLVGDAKRVATDVLAECAAADAELGFGPDATEQSCRDYLQALTR